MVEYVGDKKPSQPRGDGLSFPEIVGQDDLKQALLALATDDGLDGLLVRGEKGTAKSTAVRALRDLLPPQRAVADCPYGCPPDDPDRQCSDCRERADPPVTERPVPLVTLPLGATRERVVGTLSVADALDGDPEFEPGLLARANRGVLYVDEVNLLDDHLVDVLLDAAASGVNRVERDGVSVSHPAEFALVGTMNPEEGDLRPQLRDRFAIGTTVTGADDVDDRVAIIDRAIDGVDVADGAEPETTVDEVRDRLLDARERLSDVRLPAEFAAEIAELCRDAGVDGHRADVATARAARALAALDGRTAVIEGDVRRAAEFALPHRMQSRPFEDAPDAEDVIDEHFDDSDGDADDDGTEDSMETSGGEGTTGGDRSDADEESIADTEDGDDQGDATDGGDGDTPNSAEQPSENGDETDRSGPQPSSAGGDAEAGQSDGVDSSDPSDGDSAESDDHDGDTGEREEDADPATPLVPGQDRAGIGDATAPDHSPAESVTGAGDGSGRTAATPSVDNDGQRIRTRSTDGDGEIDAAASVRAAAARGSESVESRDLRQSVRAGEASTLVVFVVDASASMRPAMRAAKGTVLELLRDAYEERDAVAFVAFAGDDAEVLLPPTDSVTRASRHLKELPTGDRTPLPAGIDAACEVLARADPDASTVVIVTDGRANVADGSPTAATRAAAERLASFDPATLVVDAGEERAGVTDVIVDATGGNRVPLDALSAERVDAAAGAASQTEL